MLELAGGEGGLKTADSAPKGRVAFKPSYALLRPFKDSLLREHVQKTSKVSLR